MCVYGWWTHFTAPLRGFLPIPECECGVDLVMLNYVKLFLFLSQVDSILVQVDFTWSKAHGKSAIVTNSALSKTGVSWTFSGPCCLECMHPSWEITAFQICLVITVRAAGSFPRCSAASKETLASASGNISFLQPVLDTTSSQPLQPRVCENHKAAEFMETSSACMTGKGRMTHHSCMY